MKYRHERLGFMLTPDMGNAAPLGQTIAADNACFNNPQKYTDERYASFLSELPKEKTIFATAPDVFGNHAETVERSMPVFSIIERAGIRPAFVAQDGWKEETTPWEKFYCLFVGGTTEFKFRGGREAVTAAKRRGKWCHMGRVNSLQRLRASLSIGCDSADGTYLKYGPDTNWPKLKRWLDEITNQAEMPT